MRVRDWTGADYYRELGVAPTATREEITAAYRARARVLHPDTGTADPAAEQQFVRVATAYQILTGPMREEYDRARRRGQVRRPPPDPAPVVRPGAGPAGRAPRSWQLSRRGARGALWGGLALVVAGVLAATVVTMLMMRDARLRDRGIAVDALVVRDNGRARLEFTTTTGAVVRTDLPDTKSGSLAVGDSVAIRYDRAHPTRVVTAAQNLARDITLWIVAAKLLIVGTVLAVIGGRRLLRPDRAPTPRS